ncbi:hypothetical protein Tco_1372149 [Tanacetum coccineum]
MDDPNITMEEYIQLMADKARGRDQTFNLETATYGEVYCDDSDLFTDFETDFQAIIYNDASTSNQNISFEPTKMAPKRRTMRLNPSATPTPVTDTHTTTSVTNAQIQAIINEGVTVALAARDATRNGDDSHTSGTGARRPMQVAHECTYPDFLKFQPLNFKGIKGVVGLTQ